MKRPFPYIVYFAGLALLIGGNRQVEAGMIFVKLTTDSLGLGSSDLNKGKTVDPDKPGFITSSVTGQGSILSILQDGTAGIATGSNPLFVTVTASEHLDTIFGLPALHDYQAGVLFISDEDSKSPGGKTEGLGVRAFTVDGVTALREIDSGTGRAKIEGSRHVSGGTGPTTYDSSSPNGAPHVDESVNFDFDPFFNVNAQSVEVFLSKFNSSDIIDLHIERTSGSDIDLTFLGTSSSSIFEQVGVDKDKLWKLKFSGISLLGPSDLIANFSIRANDNDPSAPKGTAEHFFISSFSADASPVPEPSSLVLMGTAAFGFLGYGWRRKRQS